MNKKQFGIFLLAVIVSSFAGGIVAQFFNLTTVNAGEPVVGRFNEIRTKTIHLVGQEGTIRASFSLGLHDSPELVLYDKEGTNRFNFGLAPAGNPGLAFNDANFNRLIEIDTKYDNASINIRDSQKNIIWGTPKSR